MLSDGCADPDEEVHRVLLTKVFARRADVVSVDELAKRRLRHVEAMVVLADDRPLRAACCFLLRARGRRVPFRSDDLEGFHRCADVGGVRAC